MNHLLLRAAVLAQNLPPVPGAKPDASAPGGDVITKLIGWSMWIGLGIAVLSVIVGIIGAAAGRMSNNPRAQGGAMRAVSSGMMVGIVVGMAQFLVSLALYLGTQVN